MALSTLNTIKPPSDDGETWYQISPTVVKPARGLRAVYVGTHGFKGYPYVNFRRFNYVSTFLQNFLIFNL